MQILAFVSYGGLYCVFFIFRVLPRCTECSFHQLGEFLFEDHSLNAAQIEKQLGVKIHKDSVPFFLKPGERIITKLAFSPSKSGLNSAVLFIR